MRSKTLMVSVVVGTLLLSACGGGGGGDGDGGATTLTALDNEFQPAQLTVSSGAQIELVNEGEALHNLTIEGTGIDQDIEAGQSATVTVDLDPGEYPFVCEYHVAEGMQGTLTVE